MAYAIYQIRNTKTGDYYVGASKNVVGRLRDHRAALRNHSCHNLKLQLNYNAHGGDAFAFEVLFDGLTVVQAQEIELALLQFSVGNKQCMNKRFNGIGRVR